jgi:MFS transporter, ACS family, glucarate transporter
MLAGMPARYKALALMFALTVITYIDRVCIAATRAAMSQELGLDRVQMGEVFSAFVLGYLLFEIPGGWLADRFGARALLTRIVLWWSVFTALTGAAWSYASLLLVRFLFGCGEAGAFPGSTSALSHWFPRTERGKAQAVIILGSRLGGALAPGLVIALMGAIGWRAVYPVFAVLGLVWAVAWTAWFRDSPEQHPAVSSNERDYILATRGTVSSGARVPWTRLIRSRNIWALCGMYSGYTYGLYFYLTWLPTYLQEGRGVADDQLGFYAGLPWLVASASTVLGGWLTDRLSRTISLRWARRLPAMGGLLAAAVFLVLAALLENNTWAMLALAFSFGAADLILAVCWATCLDIGRQYAGTVSGTMNSLGQIGGVIAPVLVGWLVQRYGSWQLPLLISAAYYVVSALLWFVIDAEQPLAEAVG